MSTRYKRPLDLSILVLSHLLLGPILILMWILIPLSILIMDGRPILFRQVRVGKDGYVFTMVKFRTMEVDSLISGPGWTEPGDHRVTNIGALLRRTALDEIPQMISIWKGDMSFVGPRALPVYMHDDYLKLVPEFGKRLSVLPGATGYSLLNLPRHCSPQDRLKWDLKYINEASLFLDIKLIVLTFCYSILGFWGRGKRKAQQDTFEIKD